MRMNPFTGLLIASCFAILAGCATPSKDVLSSADYGTLPSDYKDQLKTMIDQRLKDPYSAHYEFDEPRKGWFGSDLQTSIKTRYGWFVTVHVNARNSFGGYTGSEPYTFMFCEGKIREAPMGGWNFGGLNPTAGYSD
jgi:hypothetical protein